MLRPITAQRGRNLNMQLSEGKGTLTHTVCDCELAQGYALHRAEGCSLHRVGLWVEWGTAVSFSAQGPPLYSPPFHHGPHLHALSVLAIQRPKFNCCVQYLGVLTSAEWTVWQTLTPGNWPAVMTELMWFSTCHIYMGISEWKWHCELCSIFI